MAQTEAAPAPTRGQPRFPPPPPPPWPPVPEPGGLPPILEETLPPICQEILAEAASSKAMVPAQRIKRRGAIPLQPTNSILEVPSLCLLPRTREVIPRSVPKSVSMYIHGDVDGCPNMVQVHMSKDSECHFQLPKIGSSRWRFAVVLFVGMVRWLVAGW